MGLNCYGIIGIPNVGKSTIFSALTSTQVDIANYPFCTIGPNRGIIEVPDDRLDRIYEILKSFRKVPAVIEFIDIAGLVNGAHKGEGLGNQFLSYIRQVRLIIHVVRCFKDENIPYINGRVDPINDIEAVNSELAYTDLETIEKRLSSLEKLIKSQDVEVSQKAKISKPVLNRIKKAINNGESLNSINLDKTDLQSIADLNLLTLKKQLYVCNIGERDIGRENEMEIQVKRWAQEKNFPVITICGKLERELLQIKSQKEKVRFQEEIGIFETGLSKIIKSSNSILEFSTYFAQGDNEICAWTIQQGTKTSKAAGLIHSDFERGFIRAEVYNCNDLFKHGNITNLKESGKIRVEGKEYIIKEGDIINYVSVRS